ncbi:uncharacterized protein SCHCODRAFT_02370383 [Schizophyllum commune H4-8]|uniref:uncharacterized protein n=1 Tax=Schizophyllum commune (strain H4-8 / FGSC 9210) TaxID=578458 RepID=UPI00215ECC1B|nr:uncharacterized protein SCHCODRAFT_02370383 [Schizophyllum commune H4-8]KAI5889553.1 hypothetical protein SCHCODRAFT_02370383 [Schizophyllum commune H4-8]
MTTPPTTQTTPRRRPPHAACHALYNTPTTCSPQYLLPALSLLSRAFPPSPHPVSRLLLSIRSSAIRSCVRSSSSSCSHPLHCTILHISHPRRCGRDCVLCGALIASVANRARIPTFNCLDYPGTVLVSFTIFIMPLRSTMYPNTLMHVLCASSFPRAVGSVSFFSLPSRVFALY